MEEMYGYKKRVSYLHRTAQPSYLCCLPTLEE